MILAVQLAFVPVPGHASNRTAPLEGYLVGGRCTESDLLSRRRLRFPLGVARGDLVVFSNTAGYLMHFVESRSHQFPLARNSPPVIAFASVPGCDIGALPGRSARRMRPPPRD